MEQICDKCGCDITEKVANYSKQHYDKELCMNCQKVSKKTENTEGKKADEGADTPGELFKEGEEASVSNNIPEGLKGYTCKIQGKTHVLYAGLLKLAHEKGLTSLQVVQVKDIPEGAMCHVRAIMKDGSTFDGVGTGTTKNLKNFTIVYPYEMAQTRAKARALRDSLNINMVAVEEL